MTATHATRVVDLRPRIDRQAEAERLAGNLHAAVVTRHQKKHFRATIDICPDPLCKALVALRTAVAS